MADSASSLSRGNPDDLYRTRLPAGLDQKEAGINEGFTSGGLNAFNAIKPSEVPTSSDAKHVIQAAPKPHTAATSDYIPLNIQEKRLQILWTDSERSLLETLDSIFSKPDEQAAQVAHNHRKRTLRATTRSKTKQSRQPKPAANRTQPQKDKSLADNEYAKEESANPCPAFERNVAKTITETPNEVECKQQRLEQYGKDILLPTLVKRGLVDSESDDIHTNDKSETYVPDHRRKNQPPTTSLPDPESHIDYLKQKQSRGKERWKGKDEMKQLGTPTSGHFLDPWCPCLTDRGHGSPEDVFSPSSPSSQSRDQPDTSKQLPLRPNVTPAEWFKGQRRLFN